MNGGGSVGGRNLPSSSLDSSPEHHKYNSSLNVYRGNGGSVATNNSAMSPNAAALEVAARTHRTSAGWEGEFSGGPGRAFHAGQSAPYLFPENTRLQGKDAKMLKYEVNHSWI